MNEEQSKKPATAPRMTVVSMNAAFYVLSGCSQPLIMTMCRDAGLADHRCQLYMLFYYLGPASVVFRLLAEHVAWPSKKVILKASGIALFDIAAQSMNYTGASLAGPSIFAIVYSSVTVWTALFSRIFLNRSMTIWQWSGVFTVFGGLVITGLDSHKLGPDVIRGLFLVLFGSIMHALTYVMSEGVMTVGNETLSVLQNCAVQGIVATIAFFVWQMVYTVPRFEELILEPMKLAGTSALHGLGVLFLFSLANLVHSTTFFHTLRHFPGGATSAGIMKGLQAVLVFVFTDWAFCGRTGGEEMCFTKAKFLSLATVVSGVVLFGAATQQIHKTGSRPGYERIFDQDAELELEDN